jgi:hypothetical protein
MPCQRLYRLRGLHDEVQRRCAPAPRACSAQAAPFSRLRRCAASLGCPRCAPAQVCYQHMRATKYIINNYADAPSELQRNMLYLTAAEAPRVLQQRLPMPGQAAACVGPSARLKVLHRKAAHAASKVGDVLRQQHQERRHAHDAPGVPRDLARLSAHYSPARPPAPPRRRRPLGVHRRAAHGRPAAVARLPDAGERGQRRQRAQPGGYHERQPPALRTRGRALGPAGCLCPPPHGAPARAGPQQPHGGHRSSPSKSAHPCPHLLLQISSHSCKQSAGLCKTGARLRAQQASSNTLFLAVRGAHSKTPIDLVGSVHRPSAAAKSPCGRATAFIYPPPPTVKPSGRLL